MCLRVCVAEAEVRVGGGGGRVTRWTHRLMHAHTLTGGEGTFDYGHLEKSGVWCDYTEPVCPPINHVDYLGQPRCKHFPRRYYTVPCNTTP